MSVCLWHIQVFELLSQLKKMWINLNWTIWSIIHHPTWSPTLTVMIKPSANPYCHYLSLYMNGKGDLKLGHLNLDISLLENWYKLKHIQCMSNNPNFLLPDPPPLFEWPAFLFSVMILRCLNYFKGQYYT